MRAAAKLAPQAYEVMPKVIKAGSDGVYDLSWPKQSGKEAVDGWFCSPASPERGPAPRLEAWVTKFKTTMKREPTNYAITSYNAVLVIADAVQRSAAGGQTPPRSALRDAIQATKLDSIQGPIAFDANGDILTRTVSIYQWRDGEIKYVSVAARPGRRGPRRSGVRPGGVRRHERAGCVRPADCQRARARHDVRPPRP